RPSPEEHAAHPVPGRRGLTRLARGVDRVHHAVAGVGRDDVRRRPRGRREGGETATTVRVRDGETLVTDGPFTETKELLGGYYLIDVPDLDAALGWAAKLPNAGDGSAEGPPVRGFH